MLQLISTKVTSFGSFVTPSFPIFVFLFCFWLVKMAELIPSA